VKSKFDDARLLDCWAFDLIFGEAARAENRRKIHDLLNGYPPYSEAEVSENQIAINMNDLRGTVLAHDARTQFSNAFTKSGSYFTARTDMGPVHNRSLYSAIVTKEANRPLKRSISYFERQRSKFGQLVVDGIGTGVWESEDKVVAKPLDIEDVLIPSGTLLGFDNLPFYMVRRSFTGVELQKLTCKDKRDPGWNMGMVERILRWLDEQTTQLRNTNWSNMWKPEDSAERVKEDGGWFMGDQVPTVDTFDIYAYDDSQKHEGWIRRIILDSWGEPATSGGGKYTIERNSDRKDLAPGKSDDFLYTSRKRKVYDSWQNAIAFQFADLSAVFPARYHSVRSLGWLTYGSCHMGNRLRCKFYESVFEALMQQFKVKNLDEAQRALKLDLVNKGLIDETLTPMPAAERWQVNSNLVELGLQDNDQIISRSASSYTGQPSTQEKQTEKTRYQVQAEMQATTQLVGAALSQAYQYEGFEDREMFRRLCKKHSTDVMAQQFRANCLRQGVPEKLLNNPDAWDLEHERVMGGGNKTQELQIAQWLMAQREKFDPEPQRKILRDCVLAVTDDAPRAEALVPRTPVISDSIHDTELAFGALMQGAQVSIKAGLNAVEVCVRMLQLMQGKVAMIMKLPGELRGVGTQEDVIGLMGCAKYVGGYMKVLAGNANEKQRVKKLGDVLGKLMNMVKAMAQRQQEAMQKKAQAGNGAMDPKAAAALKGKMMIDQAKAANTRESHAQKTAQRQISFEREEQRKQQQHQLEMAREKQRIGLDAIAKDLQTAGDLRAKRLSSLDEGNGDDDE
jgi:hypothetical protein